MPCCFLNNLICVQYFDENLRGQDTHGHGTGVSGVIGGKEVGVAPGVTIFSVRVLTSDNSGSWGMFADGIEQILRLFED